MVFRVAALVALVAAVVVVSVVFARPLLGLPSATPSPTRSAAATASPTVAVSPTATPSPTPSATPTRSPTASCAPIPAGGTVGGFHPIVAVRVDHQPGFDRVVFDFGQETEAQDALPAFAIDRAMRFTNIAGQPVPVRGTAFWSVRFEGASQADRSGRLVYTGSRDIQPGTEVVQNVKLVEDFEAVLIWAIGLSRLECPQVTTLRSPLRLVLDFPAPP